MKDKTTIFDFLNSINNKTKLEYNKKDLSSYMLSLWLSHSPDTIHIVNKINECLFTLPDELVYKYFMKSIPKKRRFIKWSQKEKKDVEKEKKIEEIQLTYNVSRNEAIKSL